MDQARTPSPTPQTPRSNHSYGRWYYSCYSGLLLEFGLVSSYKAMEPNGACTICDLRSALRSQEST